MQPASVEFLSVSELTKSYPGVRALDSVSWSLLGGEVHALVGENGAGKSTLVRVLCGADQPDSGTMSLEGEPHHPRNPTDALRAGIHVVHQEMTLLGTLSVAENVLLEHLPKRGFLVNRREMARRCREQLALVGLEIDPWTPVAALGIAQRQLVEIAKALGSASRLLILDEPTSTLTPNETRYLFEITKRLRASGVALLFITHHLEEIFEIADRVTVMRNGAVILTRDMAAVDIPQLVSLIAGRRVDAIATFESRIAPGDDLLRVEGLVFGGAAEPVTFSVRAGEIVGVAGLVGSGRTECARAIFGADPMLAGSVSVAGRPVRITRPADAIRHGVCLLTEDRRQEGLLLGMSSAANITLTDLARVSRRGLLRSAEELRLAERLRDQIGIRTASLLNPVQFLSGGNQQKVVLAKWLLRGSRVLIVDEPTRGIDVGTRYEFYALLRDLAEAGRGVLLISSDLPELMLCSNRLLVFSNGRLAGELEREAFDNVRILDLAYSAYASGRPNGDGR